jgi:D-sedoheptulose 7-phosphate isomerase
MYRKSNTLELLKAACESFQGIVVLADKIDQAAAMITRTLSKNGRVFFCGNGGSAADAQHLAAEFLGRFQMERAPLAAMSLTANTSTITAIANDYGYDVTFARQLRGLAREGDVLVGISTSGRSANVVAAFDVAKELGVYTIAMTGLVNSSMSERADLALQVPAEKTARIQEMHIAVGHVVCELVEKAIARAEKSACNV